jgi:hypothetical protein
MKVIIEGPVRKLRPQNADGLKGGGCNGGGGLPQGVQAMNWGRG